MISARSASEGKQSSDLTIVPTSLWKVFMISTAYVINTDSITSDSCSRHRYLTALSMQWYLSKLSSVQFTTWYLLRFFDYINAAAFIKISTA